MPRLRHNMKPTKGESPVATLTKAHIVENLFAKNLFTKIESAQIIETLFEIMKQSLSEGDDLLISGFGKFCVREKQQRRGRNPQTGETVVLAPRRVVTFHAIHALRKQRFEPGRFETSKTGIRKP
jgi:integration host factor subunit alpha